MREQTVASRRGRASSLTTRRKEIRGLTLLETGARERRSESIAERDS